LYYVSHYFFGTRCGVIKLCLEFFGGLAIDVGRQKLYYAEESEPVGNVGELSTDGTGHRVLVSKDYSKPRGIVIDVDNR